MFCICFGACKTEVLENIFYFLLIFIRVMVIFHNFVYTDQPLNVGKIFYAFELN